MLYDFFLKNLFIFVIIFFIIVLLFFLEFFYAKKFKYAIKVIDVLNFVNHDKAIILDLRPVDVYKKCHILDSINLPFNSISSNLSLLKKYKNKKIILIGFNNSESLKAIDLFKKNSNCDLYFLDGGFNSWLKDGMPTTVL